MILGSTRRGDEMVALPADTITTIDVTTLAAAHAVKLAAFLASVDADATPVRGVVYTAAGDLAIAGDVVTIAGEAAGGWVDLPFGEHAGQLLEPGGYRVGVHVGGVGSPVSAAAPAGAAEQAAAAFGDGTPAAMPATDTLDMGLPIYLAVMQPWTPPQVDDDHLGQLPWGLTQEVFAGGPAANTRTTATAGWYGESFDPVRGAFAIVRSDGPLADRVGERIRVTYATPTRDRSVLVWVRDEQQFPEEAAGEDLVLTKTAWLRLAPLALNTVQVAVETIA